MIVEQGGFSGCAKNHEIVEARRLERVIFAKECQGVTYSIHAVLVIFVHVVLRGVLAQNGEGDADGVEDVVKILATQGIDTVVFVDDPLLFFLAYVLRKRGCLQIGHAEIGMHHMCDTAVYGICLLVADADALLLKEFIQLLEPLVGLSLCCDSE